ncbi:TPA: hypothetical protein H3L61_004265 [Escherichia coli]|nr:hypothetical protein [Escherichia coli]
MAMLSRDAALKEAEDRFADVGHAGAEYSPPNQDKARDRDEEEVHLSRALRRFINPGRRRF